MLNLPVDNKRKGSPPNQTPGLMTKTKQSLSHNFKVEETKECSVCALVRKQVKTSASQNILQDLPAQKHFSFRPPVTEGWATPALPLLIGPHQIPMPYDINYQSPGSFYMVGTDNFSVSDYLATENIVVEDFKYAHHHPRNPLGAAIRVQNGFVLRTFRQSKFSSFCWHLERLGTMGIAPSFSIPYGPYILEGNFTYKELFDFRPGAGLIDTLSFMEQMLFLRNLLPVAEGDEFLLAIIQERWRVTQERIFRAQIAEEQGIQECLSTVLSTITNTFASVASIPRNLLDALLEFAMELGKALMKGMSTSFLADLSTRIGSELPPACPIVLPIALKALALCLMGLDYSAIAACVVLDCTFSGINLFVRCISTAVFESIQDASGPVLSLIAALLDYSVDPSKFTLSRFMVIQRVIQNAIPRNVDEYLELLPYFGHYFAGMTEADLRVQMPNTYAVIDFNSLPKCNLKPFMVRRLRLNWIGHLEETKLKPELYELIKKKNPRFLFRPQEIDANSPAKRVQPPWFVFSGEPGQGKSVLTTAISTALIRVLKKVGYYEEEMLSSDLLYVFNGNAKYCNGWKLHPLWEIGDWLSKTDAVGADYNSLPLMLVDTAAFSPDMAAVEEKGQYADPDAVFATTNIIGRENFSRHLMSMNNPGAIQRRITAWVHVRAANRDANGLGIFTSNNLENYDLVVQEISGEKRSITYTELEAMVISAVFKKIKSEVPGQNLDSEFETRLAGYVEQYVVERPSQSFHEIVDSNLCVPPPSLSSSVSPEDSELEGLFDGLTPDQIDAFSIPEVSSRSSSPNLLDRFFQNTVEADFEGKEEPTDLYVRACKTLKKRYDRSRTQIREQMAVWMTNWASMLDPVKKNTPFVKLQWEEIFEPCGPMVSCPAKSGLPCAQGTKWWNCPQCVAWVTRGDKLPIAKPTLESLFGFSLNEDSVPYHELDVEPLKKSQGIDTNLVRPVIFWQVKQKDWYSPSSTYTWTLGGLMLAIFSMLGARKVYSISTERFEEVEKVPKRAEPSIARKEVQMDPKSKEVSEKYISMTVPSRTADKLARITHNCCSILSEGEIKAHIFWLSSNMCVTALHLVKDEKKLTILDPAGRVLSLQKTGPGVLKGFSVCSFPERDLAIISLLGYTAQGAKDVTAYIPELIHTSESQVLRVDNKIKNAKGYGAWHIEDVNISGSLYDSLAKVSLSGSPGLCGVPYILQTSSSDKCIVGIHVAGTLEMSSFAAPFDMRDVRAARSALISVASFQGSGEDPPKNNLLERCGIKPVARFHRKIHMPTKSMYARVPYLYDISDDFWHCDHDLARLSPFLKDGEVISPLELRLSKLETKRAENEFKHFPIDPRLQRFMTKCMLILMQNVDIGLPSWDEVLNDCADTGWSGVARDKAAGPMFPNNCKGDFMYCENEVWHLKPWALEVVEELEQKMLAGTWIPFLKSVALKDEKLSKEKVELGKTRVYNPSDVFSFLLSRKYFKFLIDAFRINGPKVGILANMDPEQMAQYMKTHFVDRDHLQVTDGDIETQDASHPYETWVCFMRSILTVLNNQEAFFNIHPEIEVVNRQNLVRWFLIMNACQGPIVLSDTIFVMFNLLGSGDLLTFLINCFSLLMAVGQTYIDTGREEELELYLDTQHCPWALFGDDNRTILPPRQLQKSFAKRGYRITGADKTKPPDHIGIYNAPFCGRVLAKHEHYGWTMRLEKARIIKMVCFSKKSKFHENFPDQVLTFIIEASRYDHDTALKFMSYINLYGVPLTDYVDAPVYLGNTKPAFQRVQSWFAAVLQRALSAPEKAPVQAVFEGKEDAEGKLPDTSEGYHNGVTSEDTLQKVTEHDEETAIIGDMDKEVVQNFGTVPCYVKTDTIHGLGRPVVIAELTLSTTMNTGDLLWYDVFPSAYFDHTTDGQAKVYNRALMRCEVVVRFTCMSKVGQAGCLLAYASACAQQPGGVYSASTGPHVKIRLGSHTGAEIRIPYSSPLLFQRMTQNFGLNFDWVKPGLMILAPLVDSVASTVPIIVTAFLDKVEVMGYGITTTAITPQGKERLDPHEETEADASKVGKVLKTIGNVATTTARIVSSAAPILALMGLSKPPTDDRLYVSYENKNAFMPNMDGSFAGIYMSLTREGKIVAPPEIFGRGDPMDVATLASTPSLMTLFTYSTMNVANDQLMFFDARPGACSHVGTVFYPTVLAKLDSLFGLYRGEITYRIEAHKSAFHGGTVEIVVNYCGGKTSINSARRTYACHRVIWDLALQSVVTVTVDYVQDSAFLPTQSIGALFSDPYSTDTGPYVSIRALTPLAATPAVSDTIWFSVEAYSNDISFGFPTVRYDDPVEPQPKLPVRWAEPEAGPFDDVRLHDLADHVRLGDGWRTSYEDEIWDRYGFGEKVTNLRQVTRRFHRISSSSLTGYQVFTKMWNEWSWLSQAFDLYVYQIGGMRINAYPQGTHFYSWRSAITSDNHSGYANVPSVEPVISLNLPMLGRQVLSIRTISETLRLYTTDASVYEICLALADDASWGGMNFLSPLEAWKALFVGNSGFLP